MPNFSKSGFIDRVAQGITTRPRRDRLRSNFQKSAKIAIPDKIAGVLCPNRTQTITERHTVGSSLTRHLLIVNCCITCRCRNFQNHLITTVRLYFARHLIGVHREKILGGGERGCDASPGRPSSPRFEPSRTRGNRPAARGWNHECS
jgi:hypothetical protein